MVDDGTDTAAAAGWSRIWMMVIVEVETRKAEDPFEPFVPIQLELRTVGPARRDGADVTTTKVFIHLLFLRM